MSQNQTIWLVKRPLRPKRKNQTDKLLETTESVCCFYGKNQILGQLSFGKLI